MLGLGSLLSYVADQVSDTYFQARREERLKQADQDKGQQEAEEAALIERYAEFFKEQPDEGDSVAVEQDKSPWTTRKMENGVDSGLGIDEPLETQAFSSFSSNSRPSGLARRPRRGFHELLTRDNYLRETDGANQILVPGPKVFMANKHENRLRLPRCEIPNKIFNILQSVVQEPYDVHYPILRETLTFKNYQEKFKILLFMEEAKARIDMRQYDEDNVVFEKIVNYLCIDVPGLIDNRPSLLVGDIVIIEQPNVTGSPRFEGHIHVIKGEKILLRFADALHDSYNGECYHISFQSNRTYFKRCHYAIEQASKLGRELLFSEDKISFVDSKLTTSGESKIKWFNKDLNDRQKRAVVGVLRGQCRPSPYIIFGPPGTGKTMTVVESVLQVFKNFSRTRVIVCAPSNACVDLIAMKLIASGLMLTKKDMVRLIAHHRIDRIPIELDPFAVESSGSNPEWINTRIILSTCGSIGTLMDFTKRAGHFTHCFLDEAAQATEPEAMQVVNLVAAGKGVTVLVGDPFQLGPICNSHDANSFGLGKPLISRLFDMEPYRRTDEMHLAPHGYYDPRCITKLVESYRCCLDIISVNSSLFYMSELDCKLPRDMDLLEKMNLTFPVVFNGVQGADERHPDSSSWCNYTEVLRCAEYLRRLYDAKVEPEEIGIITPYRKQMETIRNFVEHLGFPACKIATVEEFQGSERKVIIVSLVRTTPTNIVYDLKKQLGFIFNEKRFNVATTRAKSLLIVIGDPFCLVNDDCWKTFIAYCMHHEAYEGVEFTEADLHSQENQTEKFSDFDLEPTAATAASASALSSDDESEDKW